MESLFPYSSVVPVVEKCLLGDEGDKARALSTLSALLRHVPYRSDLFPILASLTSCNKLKVKLAAYQLALRNRDDEQLILLFNQALKDLSHSSWNISMLALQILLIPVFEGDESNLDKNALEQSTLSFVKENGTQRAALAALGFFDNWEPWLDLLTRRVLASDDLVSLVRLFGLSLPLPSRVKHSDSLLRRLTSRLTAIAGSSRFVGTVSLTTIELLDICSRDRINFAVLPTVTEFDALLRSLTRCDKILPELYFSIIDFLSDKVDLDASIFCFHFRRFDAGIMQRIIAKITPNFFSDVVLVTMLNSSDLDLHLALVKKCALSQNHFAQIWFWLQRAIVEATLNDPWPFLHVTPDDPKKFHTSRLYLQLAAICTTRVAQIENVLDFFFALSESVDDSLDAYFLCILFVISESYLPKLTSYFDKIGRKSEQVLFLLDNRGKTFETSEILSPLVNAVLDDPELAPRDTGSIIAPL